MSFLKAPYWKLALLEMAEWCWVLCCFGMWLTEDTKSGQIDLTGFVILGSSLVQKTALYPENRGHPRVTFLALMFA